MDKNTAQDLSALIHRIHAGSPLDTSCMLDSYLQYVRLKLDVSFVVWICAYRGNYVDEIWKADLLDGWKIMEIKSHQDIVLDLKKMAEECFNKARSQGIGSLTRQALQHTGKTRTHRNLDARYSAQQKDEHPEKCEGIYPQVAGEKMLGVYHLDEEAESCLLVYRNPASKPFSKTDEATLMNCLIEFPRLHYWLFLERGLLKSVNRPCSPRQRELVTMLLSGIAEKQIPNKLGLSATTVHGYICDIYRNYAVRSRNELNSLWLSNLECAVSE